MARKASKFEKEVRKVLIDKDMGLNELAQQLGISLAYIYDIFNGSRPAKAQKEKIISFLGLDRSLLEEA